VGNLVLYFYLSTTNLNFALFFPDLWRNCENWDPTTPIRLEFDIEKCKAKIISDVNSDRYYTAKNFQEMRMILYEGTIEGGGNVVGLPLVCSSQFSLNPEQLSCEPRIEPGLTSLFRAAKAAKRTGVNVSPSGGLKSNTNYVLVIENESKKLAFLRFKTGNAQPTLISLPQAKTIDFAAPSPVGFEFIKSLNSEFHALFFVLYSKTA
jgi:hypothetical protein